MMLSQFRIHRCANLLAMYMVLVLATCAGMPPIAAADDAIAGPILAELGRQRSEIATFAADVEVYRYNSAIYDGSVREADLRGVAAAPTETAKLLLSRLIEGAGKPKVQLEDRIWGSKMRVICSGSRVRNEWAGKGNITDVYDGERTISSSTPGQIDIHTCTTHRKIITIADLKVLPNPAVFTRYRGTWAANGDSVTFESPQIGMTFNAKHKIATEFRIVDQHQMQSHPATSGGVAVPSLHLEYTADAGVVKSFEAKFASSVAVNEEVSEKAFNVATARGTLLVDFRRGPKSPPQKVLGQDTEDVVGYADSPDFRRPQTPVRPANRQAMPRTTVNLSGSNRRLYMLASALFFTLLTTVLILYRSRLAGRTAPPPKS